MAIDVSYECSCEISYEMKISRTEADFKALIDCLHDSDLDPMNDLAEVLASRLVGIRYRALYRQ